jgi:UDP-glucose 4-epimerase
MKYVVTGGAGFIGSNLVDKLVDESHKVHVIDNFISGKKENCNKKAIYHNIDISDPSNLKLISDVIKNTDTVFHCAALARVQPSLIDPIKYEMNNTIGLVNILKSSVDKNVRRFI